MNLVHFLGTFDPLVLRKLFLIHVVSGLRARPNFLRLSILVVIDCMESSKKMFRGRLAMSYKMSHIPFTSFLSVGK